MNLMENGGDQIVAKNDTFKHPSFLVCLPSTYATRIPNNIWMENMTEKNRQLDYKKAMEEFIDFYKHLATKSLVYLLPSPDDVPLQDLVFTANLGIVLTHLPDRKVAIVSNFTSEPRKGESEFGLKFFKSMGYETFMPETKFEGEADLKYLYGNVYIGGYGIRSELETYKWMEKTFDMKIICLKMIDEYLYHLDCSVFPLSSNKVMICKSLYTDEEMKSLEQVIELIDIDYDMAYNGVCNCLRIDNVIYNADVLETFEKGSKLYKNEIVKNSLLKKIAADNDLEVEFIKLEEFTKSGALLSCMILHMNRYNY